MEPRAADGRSLAVATAILLAVVGERLYELSLSRRNAARVRARGGIELGRGHYRWMVALHVGFLIATPLEWFLLRPCWSPLLLLLAALTLAASMALRYWAIASLGDRWNTRVLCEPGRPAVTTGPYRHMKHPNYLAVVLEFAALPLLHGGWRTAVLGSLLNAVVLAVRLRCENAALRTYCGPAAELAGTETSERG
ncbi:MAG: hypothetical protein DWQ36_24965 [Acidobacteria bacterium]|nr:MAG: hypothetical protein DWQ30_11005 [Acidobacteriota bacterium]REJ99626.1 MAG: hypothetical protein DWQ36_24965 [Acidobacteriota bacterium]